MDCDRFNGMLVSMPVLALGPHVLASSRKQNSGSNTPRAAFDGSSASFSTATASAHWRRHLSRIPPTSVVTSVVPNRRFNDGGCNLFLFFLSLQILNVHILGNRDGRNLDLQTDCLTCSNLISLGQWRALHCCYAEISTLREKRET